MKSFLTAADLEKVILAFMSSRLDYRNSLYSGLSHKSIAHLQHTQNAAARLLTNPRKSDHISPIGACLQFTILLLSFEVLSGQAPSGIVDILIPCEPQHNLRSSGRGLLVVQTTCFVTCSDRAFSVCAPQLWKSLPEYLRLSNCVVSFKSLKLTFIFFLNCNHVCIHLIFLCTSLFYCYILCCTFKFF